MLTQFTYFNPYDDPIPSNQETKLFSHIPTYEIVDKSLGTSIKVLVPTHLTVLHEQYGSKNKSLSTSENKRNKLRVFLVGSDQCPEMSGFTYSLIDRIEFHGSICFEKPVFEMISHLKRVQKVKFFLGHKQLPHFASFDSSIFDKELANPSVTTLAIIVEKKFSTNLKDDPNKCLIENVVEDIIVKIVNRSANCFPNLKKLTVNAPNTLKVRSGIFALLENLRFLKRTRVVFNDANDRILVTKMCEESTNSKMKSKKGDNLSMNDSMDSNDSDNKTSGFCSLDIQPLTLVNDETDNLVPQEVKDENVEEGFAVEKPNQADEKNSVNNTDTDAEVPNQISTSPDREASLTGLGKLLESMLGIRAGEMNLFARSSPDIPSSSNGENSPTDISDSGNGTEEVPICISDVLITDIQNSSVVLQAPAGTCDKAVSTEDIDDNVDVDESGDTSGDENVLKSDDNDADVTVNLDTTMTPETVEGEPQSQQGQPPTPTFRPLGHHPFCHDYHEFVGVPMIHGYGINITYIRADLYEHSNHSTIQMQRMNAGRDGGKWDPVYSHSQAREETGDISHISR